MITSTNRVVNYMAYVSRRYKARSVWLKLETSCAGQDEGNREEIVTFVMYSFNKRNCLLISNVHSLNENLKLLSLRFSSLSFNK